MNDDGSCCSLISEAESHHRVQINAFRSVAQKRHIETSKRGTMCGFEDAKAATDRQLAEETVQWDINGANAVDDTIHQVILNLEEKELQLVDITCQNIILPLVCQRFRTDCH
mgnify:CR=1 FL=1